MREQQRHVVLDHEQRRPGLLADAQQQRAERLGLALRDARRRLVEQQHRRAVREHAREVDDAPAARRELAHELVAEVGDAEQLEELLDARRRRRASASVDEREVQRGADRIAHLEVAFERERDRLGHGQRREQAAVLERAAEPEARARPRAACCVMSTRVVALAER